MRTPGLHVVMVVEFTIVLVLSTICALEYPLDDLVQVEPDAFEEFLDKIKAGS